MTQYCWEMGDILEAENKTEALVKIKEELRKQLDSPKFEDLVTVACID